MTLNIFSTLKKENDCNSKRQEKFELVSCPLNGKYCGEVRSAMNKNYAESIDYRRNKEFDKSIDALENAFDKTMELPESPCSVCVEFYRSTIIDSLEDMYNELESMSKGLFRTNRYQSSFQKAGDVLAHFKSGAKKLRNAV